MTWVKGKSGNPKGRGPGKTPATLLEDALNAHAKSQGTTWLKHVAKMAWADSRVMVAVMKKLIADKQSLEVDLKPELAAALLEAKQRLSKKGES